MPRGSASIYGCGARGWRRRARTAHRLVEQIGAVRLNRQPTVKPHARLRIGDVLTMALRGEVRVWRVIALAARRGPAPEARRLYEEVPEARPGSNSCAEDSPAAYEGAETAPWDGDDRH